MPVLTLNSMQFEQPNTIPEEEAAEIENGDLRKRAKYLTMPFDVGGKMNISRHKLKHKMQPMTTKREDVVLSATEGRVIRGARLRAGKSYFEFPMQQLFPIELSCDCNETEDHRPIFVEQEQIEKPKPAAAVDARHRIKQIAENDIDELGKEERWNSIY